VLRLFGEDAPAVAAEQFEARLAARRATQPQSKL
jgi:hypothetical protein